MLITGQFVVIALQSAVSLSCLSINNERLSGRNHRESDCVWAKYKSSLLVGSCWITLGIFIKAFDIWTSGSRLLSVPPVWVKGFSNCCRIAQCSTAYMNLLSVQNMRFILVLMSQRLFHLLINIIWRDSIGSPVQYLCLQGTCLNYSGYFSNMFIWFSDIWTSYTYRSHISGYNSVSCSLFDRFGLDREAGGPFTHDF